MVTFLELVEQVLKKNFFKILKIFLRLEKKIFSQLVRLVPKSLPFDSSSNSILSRGQDFLNRKPGSHFMAKRGSLLELFPHF